MNRSHLPAAALFGASVLVKIPAWFQPLAGHFGSYQATLAMMSEMMTRSWHYLLVPRTMHLWNGEPSIELLYYPFASLAAFLFGSLLPGDFDFWGRFQATVFMTLAGFFFYRLVRELFDETKALVGAGLFLFSPVTLISGISFQNEAAAMFFLVLSIYLFLTDGSASRAFLSGLVFSLAVIARFHFIFVSVALFIYWWMFERDFRRLFLLGLGSFLPLVLWLGFTYWYESGHANVYTSFFGQLGEKRIATVSVFARPEFYTVQIKSFFTMILLLPFIAGGLTQRDRMKWFFFWWFMAAPLIAFLLPKKVMDHSFYLIPALPGAFLLASLGLEGVLRKRRNAAAAALVVYAAMSLAQYARPAFAGGAEGKKIRMIGKEVQKISDFNDRIVASYGASNSLLYYSKRIGWPFDAAMAAHPLDLKKRHQPLMKQGYGNPVKYLESLIQQGAKYFVIDQPAVTEIKPDNLSHEDKALSARSEFLSHLARNYKKIVSEDGYVIYDLRQAAA